MHFFKAISGAILLAGSFNNVIGALTLSQIGDILNDATQRFNDANDDATQVTIVNGALDTNTIVQNNQAISAQLNGYTEALQGSAKLTQSQQNDVTGLTNSYTQSVSQYFDTLAGKSKDFLVPDQKAQVQDTTDNVGEANDEFITALQAVGGPGFVAALGEQRVPDDDAIEELNDEYDEGPVKRMRVFRL